MRPRSAPPPAPEHAGVAEAVEPSGPDQLEHRGRLWLAISFLACPCHLPITLTLLAGVLGGTALGALLRDHALLAGLVIGATWLAGTARGLVLIRRADQGRLACRIPRSTARARPA